MATIERRFCGQMWRIADTTDALYRAIAEAIIEKVQNTLRQQAHFTLALSGGNTPRPLYHLLATEYRHRVEWNRVHLFWGDERYVPPDHPASNYRMVRETMIEPLRIPSTNVHAVPVAEPSPERVAEHYEEHLREFFGTTPRFDLILLGMGVDGHTASLFPSTPALAERKRWVTVGEAPTEPRIRLTLTLPALNAGRSVYFLVVGVDKAEAVRKVLLENAPLPASLVNPRGGELIWWLDRESASRL
ncbi:MAG: 6-phosphogluconolactonase [Armatimonadota bacterium]